MLGANKKIYCKDYKKSSDVTSELESENFSNYWQK